MKNPFEAPQNEVPKQDESVEIDLSDLNEEFGSGIKDLEPETVAQRHEALGREYAAERAQEEAALEAVASAFFENNPFLKARFDKDPEAMQRFRSGLKSIIVTGKVIYHAQPEDLPKLPQFQKDLVKYSFDFEEAERKRNAGRRAA